MTQIPQPAERQKKIFARQVLNPMGRKKLQQEVYSASQRIIRCHLVSLSETWDNPQISPARVCNMAGVSPRERYDPPVRQGRWRRVHFFRAKLAQGRPLLNAHTNRPKAGTYGACRDCPTRKKRRIVPSFRTAMSDCFAVELPEARTIPP